MNGIKGIGFRLEDGSMYAGDYELMRAGSISKDAIDLVPHYQESPLVQKAMADLEKMLAEEQQRKEPVQTEPGGRTGRTGQTGEYGTETRSIEACRGAPVCPCGAA